MTTTAAEALTLAEIDEALAHAHATLKRLQLTGTLSQVCAAKDHLDRLLDLRSR